MGRAGSIPSVKEEKGGGGGERGQMEKRKDGEEDEKGEKAERQKKERTKGKVGHILLPFPPSVSAFPFVRFCGRGKKKDEGGEEKRGA